MAQHPVSNEELQKTLRVYAECGHVQIAAAKALGISRNALQNRLRHARPSTDRKIMDHAQTAVKGRSLDEFRKTYDKSYIVPNKIRAALKGLGRDGWEPELQFTKRAGVSLSDLSAFRSMFEEHIVLVEKTKRLWAGTPATAAAMREMAP